MIIANATGNTMKIVFLMRFLCRSLPKNPFAPAGLVFEVVKFKETGEGERRGDREKGMVFFLLVLGRLVFILPPYFLLSQ